MNWHNATMCSPNRSEERFSRNAETDLVCRLLLEKKKLQIKPSFGRDAFRSTGVWLRLVPVFEGQSGDFLFLCTGCLFAGLSPEYHFFSARCGPLRYASYNNAE